MIDESNALYYLLAGLFSAAAIAAARWYFTARPRRDDNVPDIRWLAQPHDGGGANGGGAQLPHAEPQAEPQAEPTPPQAEPLVTWNRDGTEELVAYVAAHRGIDKDWRHMHEAAKAGRYDVISHICDELHISALLTNKRGRNILHAAIDHKRYDLVVWLANSTDHRMVPKPPAFDQVVALFEAPDATGRKPFLAAAARRDVACVQAMTLPPSRFHRLGPPSTNREEFIEACELLADDAGTNAFLLTDLRRCDVCFFMGIGDALDNGRSLCERALWWPPDLEEEPWSPEEAKSLHATLLKCVGAPRADLAAWLLDELHVNPSPPSGTEWQGEHLGDFALIPARWGSPQTMVELEHTEMQKDAAAEYEHSRDERQSFRRDREYVLNKWDGLSSESLVEQTRGWLDRMRRHEEPSDPRHEDLIKWVMHASGRPLLSRRPVLAEAGTTGTEGDASAAMLQMLTGRLGVKGAPRLQVIVLTGSAWALRWLLDSNLVDIETPLGGAKRLRSLEEGGDDNCAVCRDGMLSPVRLPCGHEVCRVCIRDWFRHSTGTSRCPLCNTEVEAPDDVLPYNLIFALSDDLAHHPDWQRFSSRPLGDVLAALAAYRGALSVHS